MGNIVKNIDKVLAAAKGATLKDVDKYVATLLKETKRVYEDTLQHNLNPRSTHTEKGLCFFWRMTVGWSLYARNKKAESLEHPEHYAIICRLIDAMDYVLPDLGYVLAPYYNAWDRDLTVAECLQPRIAALEQMINYIESPSV